MLLPYHILLASNLRCSIQHRSQWHSLVLHWQKVVVIPNFCAFHCTSRSWLYTNIPYLWPNLLYYHIIPSLVLLYSALCLLYIYVQLPYDAFMSGIHTAICLHSIQLYYHTLPPCSLFLLSYPAIMFIFTTIQGLCTIHFYYHNKSSYLSLTLSSYHPFTLPYQALTPFVRIRVLWFPTIPLCHPGATWYKITFLPQHSV